MISFRIEPLDRHPRKEFDCGVEPLNQYFHKQVGQDVKRHVTFCYVAVDSPTGRVAGFYTLAATSILLSDLPASVSRRLPRYPTLPAVRVGRLAVDLRFRGCRLGGVLLYDAIDRTCRSGIAAYAVLVDAKDEAAAQFYEHHGFIRFGQLARTLYLPISETLRRLSKP